jgi:TPP-dependent pyruvate/acetoin dehydrogenase alpha subunit
VDGRPQEEYTAWSERCPIAVFEDYLKTTSIPQTDLDEIKASVTREIEEAVQVARQSPDAEITDFEALVYA